MREILRGITDHDRVLRAGRGIDQASRHSDDILIGPARDPKMGVKAAKRMNIVKLVLLPV